MARTQHEPRWWQRLVQRFASTRPGSWVFSHTLHHVDRVLMRLSRGRLCVPGVLAGLPVVRLTTIGAKTGKERHVPVLGLRDGDRWVLVASNWGSDEHPAWYHNLRANPEVTLTHDDRSDRYVAREATGDERADYWHRAEELYVGFDSYRTRSGDREIPVVVLAPQDG